MERKNSRKVVAGILLGSVLAGQVSLGVSREEAFVPLVPFVAAAPSVGAKATAVAAEACVAPWPFCVGGPLVAMGGTLWVMEMSHAVTSFVIRKIVNRGKILGTSGESPE